MLKITAKVNTSGTYTLRCNDSRPFEFVVIHKNDIKREGSLYNVIAKKLALLVRIGFKDGSTAIACRKMLSTLK